MNCPNCNYKLNDVSVEDLQRLITEIDEALITSNEQFNEGMKIIKDIQQKLIREL